MSAGTVFYKALSEAMAKRNENYKQDIKAIRAFIEEHTGFRVTHIKVDKANELRLRAVAK